MVKFYIIIMVFGLFYHHLMGVSSPNPPRGSVPGPCWETLFVRPLTRIPEPSNPLATPLVRVEKFEVVNVCT